MKKTDAKDAVLTRVSRNTRDLATAGCIATCNNQINRLQACSQKHFPARHPLGEGKKKRTVWARMKTKDIKDGI